MSSIQIHDLAQSKALDPIAMSAIRGGMSVVPKSAFGFANVNVGVNIDQQIIHLQSIDVNVLNNNKIIGADLGFHMDLDPSMYAMNKVAVGHA